MALGTVYSQPPSFSWFIFFILFLIFAASTGVFWTLVRRWTSHRDWIALQEWARENGFSLLAADRSGDLPPPLAALGVRARVTLSGRHRSIVRLEVATGEVPGEAPGEASGEASGEAAGRFNVLLSKGAREWIPSALRPAHESAGLIDRANLAIYPAYSTAERFHLCSADPSAARRLSKSSARALLPADIGLLLWGEWLILDFTLRPFDPIEFGRMLALAEQLTRVI